ncbi:MAG TPA: lactonase family protein [Burkholderiales bacterium]|jgi:6-phosphogluconolactonase (cycloisomerase 2 family)|nr:lactonase family protein [Burkholderiales bacterium]
MSAQKTTLAYVGCYTTQKRSGRGKGINVYRVGGDGAWTHEQLAQAPDNPSFLQVDGLRNRLYAVHGDGGQISTYAIGANGHLESLGENSVEGTNPVHLTPTPDGRWMIVADYASGNVVSLPIANDGTLGAVAGNLAPPGARGPHPTQQKGSHPHMTHYDRSGRWLLVPDKGYDRVFTLKVDLQSGALSVVSSMATRPAAGPRHLAFHPMRPWVYLVGELDATLIVCRFDAATGTLTTDQVIDSMPADYTGEKSCAGIAVSPDGTRVYMSNRPDHSISVFAVDLETGDVKLETRLPSGGEKPRFISLGQGGKSLLVANEAGDNILELPLAGGAPHLRATTGSPVCIVFKEIA